VSKKHKITNRLHKSLQETMCSMLTAESLFAAFMESKFKRAGVRLSEAEKERVRHAAAEYLRTNEISALESAITRRRKIHIEITDTDVEKFVEGVTKAQEGATEIAAQSMARTMAKEVMEWADAEVEWTKAIRYGFESRLARTWRTPLRHYARFLRAIAYTNELVTAQINDDQLLESSCLAKALLMLHARAFSVASEVEVLMHSGFADGASARWRTLHEISVTAAFLVEHGEDAAVRYLDHFPCEQLKSANLYEEHQDSWGEGRLDAEFMAALKADVDRLAKQYGEPFRRDNGWAAAALQLKKVTFLDIERAVKLNFMRPYYRGASEQVHASSRGAVIRTGLISQDSTLEMILAGPSNYGLADPAINSSHALLNTTLSLLQVVSTVDAEVFSIILGKWLGPLARCFVKAQRGIEDREKRYEGTARRARSVRATSHRASVRHRAKSSR
jgi:hypothetical protein